MVEAAPPQMPEAWPIFLCFCAAIFWIFIRPLLLWILEGVQYSRPHIRKFIKWLNYRLANSEGIRQYFYSRKSYSDNSRKLTRAELQKLSRGLTDKKFRPWRRDYYTAIATATAGMLWFALCSYLYLTQARYFYAFMGMLCVAPFNSSLNYFERARRRVHGKKVENLAIQRFKTFAPKEWDVVPNQLMNKYDDIDLLVRLDNDELCVIEIKSWHHFKNFWRVHCAFRQVSRQRRSSKASYGCIWLPYSRGRMSHANGRILIIGGNTQYLIEQIRDFIRNDITIKFPRMPSYAMRSKLKQMGFHWNKASVCWEGKPNKRDLAAAYDDIIANNGIAISGTDAYEIPWDYESSDFYEAV